MKGKRHFMKKKWIFALFLCAAFLLFGCGEEECTHQNCDEIIINEPTCTEDGLIGYTCRDCGLRGRRKFLQRGIPSLRTRGSSRPRPRRAKPPARIARSAASSLSRSLPSRPAPIRMNCPRRRWTEEFGMIFRGTFFSKKGSQCPSKKLLFGKRKMRFSL